MFLFHQIDVRQLLSARPGLSDNRGCREFHPRQISDMPELWKYLAPGTMDGFYKWLLEIRI
jgi:hypothetical protein